MNTLFASLALLVVAALVLLKVLRRSDKSKPPSAAPRPAAPVSVPRSAPTAPPASSDTPSPVTLALPAALQSFQRLQAGDLDSARWYELLQRLGQIPRPPKSLQRLVSTDFVQTATSLELSELVLGEPEVAAKVIATVNSPLYGLSRPVVSIGQSITFLGLNTVRGICLRYMLDHAFPVSDPVIKRALDRMWNASALASELTLRLAPRLGLPDTGALVTQVVLSYLGHQAALSLLTPAQVQELQRQDLLTRTQQEQAWLGLGGAELGRLLMQSWELPEAIVSAVTAVDGWLEQPANANNASTTGTALCYLCSRLGEKLAFGEWTDLASHPLQDDNSIDLLVVKHQLLSTHGDRLSEALAAPELQQALQPMLEAMAAPAA